MLTQFVGGGCRYDDRVMEFVLMKLEFFEDEREPEFLELAVFKTMGIQIDSANRTEFTSNVPPQSPRSPIAKRRFSKSHPCECAARDKPRVSPSPELELCERFVGDVLLPEGTNTVTINNPHACLGS